MKHFIKKTTFAGAGGTPPRPKIQAGTLRAPQLGRFDIAASYSTIEIVDLLCDGPIHSIVNDEGADVTNDHLMQGIYLDNTPVEVSNSTLVVDNFDVKYYLDKKTNYIGPESYYISDQLNSLVQDLVDQKGFGTSRKSYLLQQRYSNTFFYAEYDSSGTAEIRDNNSYTESVDFMFLKRDSDSSETIASQNYLSYNPNNNPPYEQSFNTSSNTVWDRIIWNPTTLAVYDEEINYGHYFVNKQDGLLEPKYTNIANVTSELHYYNQFSESSLDTPNSLYTVFFKSLNQIKQNGTVEKLNVHASQMPKMKSLASSLMAELKALRDAHFGKTLIGRKTPSDRLLMLISIGKVDFSDFANLTNFSDGTNANINTDALKMYIPNFDSKNGIVKVYFIPKVNANGFLTNQVCGLISISIPLTYGRVFIPRQGVGDYWKFPKEITSTFGRKDLTLSLYKTNESTNQRTISSEAKYNFSNLLCEFKAGAETQKPLGFFNSIHIDYEYNQQLLGPFRTAKEGGRGVRRLQEDPELRTQWGPDLYEEIGGVPSLTDGKDVETSIDSQRKSQENYSEWNKDNDFDEDASPVMHTIENPNVASVYFTLGISSLKDTASADIIYNKEVPADGKEPKVSEEEEFRAGDTYPAILVINVEWGRVVGGVTQTAGTRYYRIVCQVNGQLLIDFGQPDATAANQKNQTFVTANIKGGKGDPKASFKTFDLPAITEDDNSTLVKRYIKITKVSTETNSVLISRECSLVKVTEIIEANLSYPFSAMAGIKMDSRVFANVPERSYDCRLKRIKIPSNYQPLFSNGTDKRYILDAAGYKQDYKIYEKDWNGKFKDGWTDNPAWILYDILTNTRYGLGSYLEESQINIWELYKIGRFCDAVNDDGYFIGVSDGIKGLEPRYSCNILFKESIKIFDAINVIANLFRGAVFFANSEIHFIDDRPRAPIALFSNTHVKDGIFSYSNNRRDQQFNTIEVSYLDRFDNFKSKIEFIEDESDIRKRGVFKTTINTIGVTSRSMARRIGQHMIYQTIKENQGVEFKAGLETLLCRPGDLIIIEDEMKTQQTNFGRILKKDLASKSLYIENEFNSGAYNNKITVYSPTGYTTSEELDTISASTRSRLNNFTLATGGIVSGYLAAKYEFSHYLSGFAPVYSNNTKSNDIQEYFAYYTGKNSADQDVFCYYNTGFSGWIFSTGQSFTDDTGYDKLILNTGVYTIQDVHIADAINNQTGFIYDISVPNRRSATIYSGVSAQITYSIDNINDQGGILDEEISTVNNPQVVTFEITGYNNSGLNNNNYGSTLYLSPTDNNINLLEFVQDGSPYRIERLNSESQIYKVLTIREDSQNEYTVVATKYNTGKFAEIENFSSNLLPADTFNTAPLIVNNVIVAELNAPVIDTLSFKESQNVKFWLDLTWKQVAGAVVGYEVIFTNNKGKIRSYKTDQNKVSLLQSIDDFNNPVEGFGYWTAKVKAIGNGTTSLDSYYSEKTIFVAYLTNNSKAVPVVIDFNIS
jgi:hypothetical protein